MIELSTLGELLVSCDHVRIRLATRKEYALLVYLGLHQGRVIRRDQLTALLWDESAPVRARHSLSQALYGLRRKLPELSLESAAEELWLSPGSLRVDVVEFERALREGRPEDAISIYRGPFLDGFWLRQSAAFEEWQELIRGNLSRSAESAMFQVAQIAEEGGNWTDAERIAARLLDLDPFNEGMHRLRISAIAASGQVRRAVAEHRRICEQIVNELGREPEPATLSLGAHIGSARAAEPEREVVDDEGESPLAFVGRTVEFSKLREQWSVSRAGHGRAVLVLGEAGMGKTRLCRHFLRLGVLQGAKLLAGRCYQSESRIPYSGIVDALLRGIRIDDVTALPPSWAAVVLELLPELRSSHGERVELPRLGGEGARRRLFEGTARLLQTASVKSPIILYIDDFQWADESTAALIHYLARRIREHAVLLLLALRPEEISTPSSVWQLVGDRADLFQVLHVPELDQRAVEELVSLYQDRHGIQLTDWLRNQIFIQAGGRPFFIIETLKAIEHEELEVGSSQWAPESLHRPPALLSASVEDFLKRRFERLGAEATQAMGALGVLGKDLDLHIAQAVSGLSTEAFIKALEELERKGFVRAQRGDVTFCHDLIREAAYRSLSGPRRRLLHERAAKLLERDAEGRSGTLAAHFELAGNTGAAYEHAVLAADASEKMYALKETEFFLRMALANANGDRERLTVRERLAKFLNQHHRFAEAEAHFAELEAWFTAAGNTDGLLTIEINRAWLRAKQGSAATLDLVAIIDSLATTADEMRNHRQLSIVLRLYAEIAHDAGRADVVLSIADRLTELGKSAAGTPTGVLALTSAAKLLGLYRTTEEGITCSQNAIAQAENINDMTGLIAALAARATNRLQAGFLEESASDFRRALGIAERFAIPESRHALLNDFGVLHLEIGAYEEAELLFRQAAEVATESAASHELLFFYSNLAQLYLERGYETRAEEMARKLLSYNERVGAWWSAIIAYGILGLCATEQGKLRIAKDFRREILSSLSRGAYHAGDVSYGEMFLARLSALEGEAPKAIERLDRVIDAYAHRDIFCRSRLELERARLLVEIDKEQARQGATEVRNRAATMGARPLVEKADAILDRIRFRG